MVSVLGIWVLAFVAMNTAAILFSPFQLGEGVGVRLEMAIRRADRLSHCCRQCHGGTRLEIAEQAEDVVEFTSEEGTMLGFECEVEGFELGSLV